MQTKTLPKSVPNSLDATRRRSRFLAPALALVLASTPGVGCAPVGDDGAAGTSDRLSGTGAVAQPVTVVTHGEVRRQSIGNCWAYATVGWVESLRRSYLESAGQHATEEDLNLSESWVTYWHWYRELTSGEVEDGGEIQTGGFFGLALDIMSERGVVSERAFLPNEATAEMSAAQDEALEAMNTSVQSGALASAAARRDGAVVRRELNRAFGLSAAVIAEMDRVFGADGRRTLASTRPGGTTSRPMPMPTPTSGTSWIRSPASLQVYSSARADAATRREITLADAFGTAAGGWNPDVRRGTYAWQSVDYPFSASSRQAVIRRVQQALNDGAPVVLSWLVDFNALDNNATFRMDELRRRGIGHQGGHLSLLNDYTVDGAPPGARMLGLGPLPAADRAAALQGTVRMFEIKNSWGRSRADRSSNNGYYNLNMDYLDGSIAFRYGENPNAPTLNRTPLNGFMLPPGY